MKQTRGWVNVLKWSAVMLGALFVLALIVPDIAERISGPNYHHAKWYRDLSSLAGALDSYAERNEGRYPRELPDLCERGTWSYAILSRIPLDPWGSPYVYVPATVAGARPIVFCAGPDRTPATDDDLRLDRDE
jgi:Type II secretion system (T2SS), protein G